MPHGQQREGRKPEVGNQASDFRRSLSDRGAPERSVLARVEFAAAAVLCLVIVALHGVVLLNAGGMWRDEINSIGVAEAASLDEFRQLLRIATFPVPYFVLLRIWIEATGGSDAALRVLVFLVGSSIPLALWSGARLLRPDPGRRGGGLPLISLALFGLNADALWHGDMVRGYGLATICLVLGMGFVWKLAVAPTRTSAVCATLALVGTTQCLFQNALFVLAICLGGAAVAARRALWKRAVVILAVGAVAAAGMAHEIPQILDSRETHVVDQGNFVLRDALTVALRTLNSSGGFLGVVWGGLFLLGLGIAMAAQFPAVLRVSPEQRDLALYLAVAVPLGLAGFCLFFFGIANFGVAARYYTVLLAFAAVFFDAMASVLPATRWRRVLVLGLSLFIAAASLPRVWAQCHVRHTGLDRIADRLETAAGKQDLIVVMPCMYGTTFHRYYQGQAAWITLPEIADFKIQRDDLWKARLGMTNAAASALAKMSRTLRSGNKVWFVGQPVFPAAGQRPPALPPAPFGPQGWFYGPYEEMWALEAGDLLQQQALRGQVVVKSQSNVNPDENLPLLVFEGWRPGETSPPTTQ